MNGVGGKNPKGGGGGGGSTTAAQTGGNWSQVARKKGTERWVNLC